MTGRPTARAWIDAAVPVALTVIALLGFTPAFGGGIGFLVAGIGGLLLGAAVAAVGVLTRLSAPLTLLAGLIAYVLFGSAIATPATATLFVLPNLETLRALAIGPVFGWADLVTIGAPVQAPPHVLVVPYFCGWLVGLVDVTLALRWLAVRRAGVLSAGVLLLGPLGILFAGILTGTHDAYLALARGLAFAVLALIWLGFRLRPPAQEGVAPSRALLRRRIVGTAVLLTGAVAVGAAGGVVAAPIDADRLVVRDHVVPPFDVESFTSPLAGFRAYTQADTDVVLTATGLPAGARIRLAAMDGYDGILWKSTNARQAADASGSFSVVGETVLPPEVAVGPAAQVTIRIGAYDDVWLPVPGYLTSVAFQDADAAQQLSDLRYNRASGTAVVPTRITTGDEYTVTVVQPVEPDDAQLADADPGAVELPPVEPIQILSSTATEVTQGAKTPFEKLRALETWMLDNGYLSHGGKKGTTDAPSPAGHGADRMVRMFSGAYVVGDAEQYASAFAIMARSLGMPSRVVMGFRAPNDAGGTVEFTGADVTAWVEVAFEGYGWVAFDPTPDEKEIPLEQVPEPQSKPRPQVRQPPHSIENPEDLVAPLEVTPDDKKDPDPFGIPGWILATAGWVGGPLIVILVVFLIVGGYKARRRARRRAAARAADRVTGAWDELLDGYAEFGYPLPARLTRTQLARVIRDNAGGPAPVSKPASENTAQTVRLPSGVVKLAAAADRAAFSGRDLTDDEVDVAWERAREELERVSGATSVWRRVVSRFYVRRLRRR